MKPVLSDQDVERIESEKWELLSMLERMTSAFAQPKGLYDEARALIAKIKGK